MSFLAHLSTSGYRRITSWHYLRRAGDWNLTCAAKV